MGGLLRGITADHPKFIKPIEWDADERRFSGFNRAPPFFSAFISGNLQSCQQKDFYNFPAVKNLKSKIWNPASSIYLLPKGVNHGYPGWKNGS
jgi:hypothetical protein